MMNVIGQTRSGSILVELAIEELIRLVDFPAEVDEMGELLQGAPLWVLQQYVPLHAMVEEWQQFDVYQPEQLHALAARAGQYVDQVQVRGI